MKAHASPKPKGYRPKILVTTGSDENHVLLKVHDNGTGIPKDIIKKIFEPLFTTKPTRKGNTGMGLSLSYDIITQRHQGQIDVTSKEGDFSEFTIKLPKSTAKVDSNSKPKAKSK